VAERFDTNGQGKSTLVGGGSKKNPRPERFEERVQQNAIPADPDCPECEGSGRGHYAGQIGSEPTPAAFIDALIAVTAECVRVLKPSGSLFVNLGDKYVGGGQGGNVGGNLQGPNDRVNGTAARKTYGLQTKSLMGLPWRYALACIDDLGLILRSEIIWCLSGGARVYAEIKGEPRPIMLRDLVRSYQPGDVRLWNGEKWTRVLGWNRSPDTDGALELELRSGERVGCTPGHQWPTARGLVRADEIRVGDVIDYVKLPQGDRRPAGLDAEDVGWFVGMYMAEGSRSGTMIQFTGHVNETDRHERLARIAEHFDGECNVYQTGENTANAHLSSSVLSGILDRYLSRGTAKTKHLTRHAWARSDKFLWGVMTGYLEGDGHHDIKNDRWRLGFTVNDDWAADLRTLAARLGATLTLKRCIHRGNYGDFPGWRGEWRWVGSEHHNAKPRSEVVAIRASRARQFFDVGVADEPHTFALASGVLTHNSKPNGLPESVQDRVRRSHEQWFHFTLEPRYYSAVDEIREAHASPIHAPGNAKWAGERNDGDRMTAAWGDAALGKLPGSVWQIPTEPLRVPDDLPQHFAAFPSEWPRRIILGWSPTGICTECGFLLGSTYDKGMLGVRRADHRGSHRPPGQQAEGPEAQSVLLQDLLEPVELAEPGDYEVPPADHQGLRGGLEASSSDGAEVGLHDGAPAGDGRAPRSDVGAVGGRPPQERGQDGQPDREPRSDDEVGPRPPAEATAQTVPVSPLRRPDPVLRELESCPNCGGSDWRDPVILDPFVGTGTVPAVANALGRHGIGIDLSADYLKLARWRCQDPGLRAKVLGVDKPAAEVPGQMTLLS
jgi:hypothetical protein